MAKKTDLSNVQDLSNEQLTEAREFTEYSEFTVLCFKLDQFAYAVTMKHIDHNWLSYERSSSGYRQARIRLDKTQKAMLRNRKECRKLGKYDDIFNRYIERIKELNDGKLPKQLNKGHAYECWLTEEAGQEWKPDNLPFWMGADLEANGTTYQIKGENAEYFTETNIANALRWKAEQARA